MLRPGGTFIAATIARNDSPELGAYWTRPETGFDAEEAPGLVAGVFRESPVPLSVTKRGALVVASTHPRSVPEDGRTGTRPRLSVAGWMLRPWTSTPVSGRWQLAGCAP